MAKGENIFRRRDGRWEARYIKGRELSGKIKYGYCYGKTYREAKEKAAKRKAALANGAPLPTARTQKPFSSYCLEWLHTKKCTVKESTYIKYSTAVNKHIIPKLGVCRPLGFTIEKHDVILLLFSTSYFVIYTFNFGFAVKSLIIYLWGPWAAYLFGKWFVLSDNSDRSFQEMTNTLTFGFFLHGVLNLLAYLKSDYYAQYAYQRVSVDFWRGDMVSVISTGFMFTFAVALSTSILFSHCGVRKKLIALAVLLMSTFEASFFAYRTMIFIVLILVAFNLLRWLHDSSVRISRKALLIGLAALFFVAIFAIVFLNAFGIQDELLSLKIVRRLLYDDKSSRFKTWTSYLFSGDWLRYPFGGQKSEFAYHGEWVHNLWLDILNKVGLIPFVIAVIFTITSIRSAYGAAVRMKKTNHNLLSNQIASLGLGALLICMPEPVVDANPYFFFAILMLLGGIKGVECSFGKEDTAESERGF